MLSILTIMATNRAAWLPHKQARPVKIDDAPMPTPKANEIIIHVHAVAINPADVAVQNLGLVYEHYPVVTGCDAAGVIIDIGSEVQGSRKGDRVVASMYSGAFQQYCPVTAPFAAKLPDDVNFTDAVVLPLALITSTVCLFEKDMLALDYPKEQAAKSNGKVLVVWGGSSALGSCAIQMAKIAGYEVAALASKRNFDYCRRLGADYMFDYSEEDGVGKIVKALEGKDLAGVYCAVFADGIVGKCAQIAYQMGGRRFVSVVYPPAFPIKDEIPDGVQIGQCKFTCRRDLAWSG